MTNVTRKNKSRIVDWAERSARVLQLVYIYLIFFTNFFTDHKTIKFYCVLQPAVMLQMLWGCLCTSDILGTNYYFKKPHNSSNSRLQKGYFQLLSSCLELSCVSASEKSLDESTCNLSTVPLTIRNYHCSYM